MCAYSMHKSMQSCMLNLLMHYCSMYARNMHSQIEHTLIRASRMHACIKHECITCACTKSVHSMPAYSMHEWMHACMKAQCMHTRNAQLPCKLSNLTDSLSMYNKYFLAYCMLLSKNKCMHKRRSVVLKPNLINSIVQL